MVLEKDPDEGHDLEIAIEKVKRSLGIDRPNSDMSPEEIQAVTRKFGEQSPDTSYDQNGEPVFGPEGMASALSVASYFIFVVFDGR